MSSNLFGELSVNKQKMILVLAAVFAGTAQWAAANSADLLITGRLIPPACTPTLSGGAVIDYGDIPVSNLSASAAHTLEDRDVSLTVTCEEDAALGIRITDARAESKPLLGSEIPQPVKHSQSNLAVATANTQTMGLGNDAAAGKLGVWWMTVDRANLRATNSLSEEVSEPRLLYSDNSGISWGETTTSPLNPHFAGAGVGAFAIKGKGVNTPAVATVHTFPMVVGAALNTKGRLNVKDDTTLDGVGTFTIYYQ